MRNRVKAVTSETLNDVKVTHPGVGTGGAGVGGGAGVAGGCGVGMYDVFPTPLTPIAAHPIKLMLTNRSARSAEERTAVRELSPLAASPNMKVIVDPVVPELGTNRVSGTP